ncbi:MAG: ribonuclease HI [Ardenticatenales bacterium]|nr:ribonuclease HI [Ardenticatenales bacterium]
MMQETKENVVIYTDGGADPNPGIGGWAAILRFGRHEKVLTGHDPNTTNNRMELQAAIAALQALKRPCQVELYTDSEYLRRGITEWITTWAAKGWKRGNKPVPNADLWQVLWELAQAHEIEWHWVRGHAGISHNERVDELARQARLSITPAAALDPHAPRLYVRAACKGNPGPGGWGVVLEEGADTRQLSGSAPRTTNNRMELMGALEGLALLPTGTNLHLFTTSDYLFQGATRWIKGWRLRDWHKKDGQPIANADLWQALDQRSRDYHIHWVNAKGAEEMPEGLQEASRLAQGAIEMA